jgi:hypothetical protein
MYTFHFRDIEKKIKERRKSMIFKKANIIEQIALQANTSLEVVRKEIEEANRQRREAWIIKHFKI